MATLAPMPPARLQFFSANGVPLAAGQIFTYAAGTTTPQATYTDATGNTANANPVVLDAGGFASIWLGQSAYKIVVEDVNGVTQWTADNVSAVSLAQLAANSSFSSISVSGNSSIGGNETVSGSLTAASLSATGTATVGGAITAASAAISNNETVGGTLDVTGATTLAGGLTVSGGLTADTVAIGSGGATQTLTQLVQALIPTLSALSGQLVVSNVSTSGNWVIFTFGTTTGTRTLLAFGAGTGVSNGTTLALPSGFSASQLLVLPSLANVNTTSGNQLDNLSCSASGGVINVAASDNSGHNFTPTANWIAVAWLLNQ